MSSIDFFGAPAGETVMATPRTPTPAPVRGRQTLLIVGLLAAAVALLAGLVVLRPDPRDDRPVVLPDTLAGLPAAETRFQFAENGDWRTQLAETYGDHPFDGRAFGSVGAAGAVVNLVVVRADSRGKADLALGRPPYMTIGRVSCTRTFQFPALPGQEQSKPHRSDTMLVCWRAADTLTVSLLVLSGGQGYERTAAQAVDEVWALER